MKATCAGLAGFAINVVNLAAGMMNYATSDELYAVCTMLRRLLCRGGYDS